MIIGHTPVGTTQRMTSAEIALLVESRHDKVKQSIERLAARGVIVQPPMGDEPETDALGRTRITKVYVFTGEQGKRDSIIVVAQLCPEFTARLVDRWAELEARSAQPVALSRMQLLTMAMAAETELQGALAELEDSRETIGYLECKVEESASKVEALGLIAEANGSFCLTDAAKLLQMRRIDLEAELNAREWIYRRAGTGRWRGHALRERQGLVTHKVERGPKADGTEWVSEQVRITPKGIAKLAEIFGKTLGAGS
ncbi:DNA-binding protein [Novosphingobium sp. FGD1]|uniref:DNA-binding protein n=1 Tax=Novosphingobium silvae TaxID=2692619 RepID=A0A7X4K6J6_9SPHN|nr:phage antirepressor KilAC domain-containing protein [Novosphingobium silvae]MYL97239.1 DNA-binding protein [Novosphingobium silvae]